MENDKDNIVSLKPPKRKRNNTLRPGIDHPMFDEPTFLGPHDRMTVPECLNCVSVEEPENVLILYNYVSNEGGIKWAMRSSELTKAEALYLLEKAKQSLLSND